MVEKHSGTTGRARVVCSNITMNGCRGSVFVKLAPFDADQRAFVDQVGMGVAEVRFYTEIAVDVPAPSPDLVRVARRRRPLRHGV